MIEQAHLKAKNDLYNIVSNLAYQDYYNGVAVKPLRLRTGSVN